MAATLVITSLTAGAIDDLACQAVGAAVALGDRIVLGVVADHPERVVADGGIEGVDEILGVQVQSDLLTHEIEQSAVRMLIEHVHPASILMGFTARATAFAAALAYDLDLGFASDVVRLTRDEMHGLVATRYLYNGKVQANIGFDPDRPALLLLRPYAWEPAERTAAGSCRVIGSCAAESRVRCLERASRTERQFDLTGQQIILAVGRGVGSREGVAPFSEIAAKLGVALAGSRPVVDAGWLPRDRLVGQSGSVVAPRLYLAFGISGAPQHVIGMRGAQTIVAVNNDADAPIFGVADYGAVADIFEVAAELQKLT